MTRTNRTPRAAVWFEADFRLLWLATTVAALGDFFRLFAIPLLVFSLTGSALNTGAALAAETVPYLVVSPLAGVFADRADRRRVMIATRVAQFAIVGSLPGAYYTGLLSLPQIFAVSFAAGSADVVFGAASLAGLTHVVAPSRLVAANSALQLTFSLSALVGPPLAGAVVGATGKPAAALAADAGVQILAAAALIGIRRPMRADRTGHPARSVTADTREGLAYLWRHPLLRTSAFLLFAFNFMLGGTLGQLVVFGKAVLGLPSLPLSILYSGEGVGAIVAAALAPRIGRRWPLGKIVVVALPVSAASVLVLSAASNLVIAVLALATLGMAETIMFVNLIALRQRIVPSHLQGRVNATARALAVSGTPAGALFAGALVTPLGGVRPVLALLGFLALINAMAALFTQLRTDPTRGTSEGEAATDAIQTPGSQARKQAP